MKSCSLGEGLEVGGGGRVGVEMCVCVGEGFWGDAGMVVVVGGEMGGWGWGWR